MQDALHPKPLRSTVKKSILMIFIAFSGMSLAVKLTILGEQLLNEANMNFSSSDQMS